MANSEIAQKKDFVELEFLGKNLTNNEVFDTNITEEAKKIKLELSGKPLIVCVGQGMVVKGFDQALEGKELGKKYSIKLEAENAFGKRNKELVRLIPLKMFLAQKIMPEPGMVLALDNNLVKVMSVNGGRVLVDFNNPLAGKDIEYEFTIKRKISEIKEKVKALQLFFFGQEFDFDIDEEKKKVVFKDLKLMPIMNAFNPQFQELLGYGLEILEKPKKENKEDKKEENQEKSSVENK
ncbi:peptidylprolyl isomerase [Candidatus Pacearchaeota archaeon]|nr:peptidylprolyl isomerase [Candidatus Pacearchaeota archaeon]